MAETFDECVFCQSAGLGLWRSESLYVLLDIAPMMEGHLLICSADHQPSAADLPAEVADELDEVCDWIRSLYLRSYGAFAAFEHGRTGHCVRLTPDERICHHMHIHVMPLAADLTADIGLSQRTTWQSWRQVAELGADTEGYLVVDSDQAGRQFYPVTHSLAPHYLRTKVGGRIGAADRADWEKVVGNGSSAKLLDRARRTLGGLIAAEPLWRSTA